MADEPDRIVLVLLRRMDEKLDRLIDDMRDLKVRTTSLEETRPVFSGGWTGLKRGWTGSSGCSTLSTRTETDR